MTKPQCTPKLSQAEQEEVLKRWLAGETQTQLAAAFGVTQSAISAYCRRLLGLREGTATATGEHGARTFVHVSREHPSTTETPAKYELFVPPPNPLPLPQPNERIPGEAQRFWAMVRITTDEKSCWEWDRTRMDSGYGNFSEYDPTLKRSKGVPASRTAWRITYGEIPPKKVIGHRCDNRPCCRPDHLCCITQRQNMLDCFQKGRGKQGWRLNWEKVEEMRRLREQEGWTIEVIAEHFKCSISQASNVVGYKQWTKKLSAGWQPGDGQGARKSATSSLPLPIEIETVPAPIQPTELPVETAPAAAVAQRADEIARRWMNGTSREKLAEIYGVTAAHVARLIRVSMGIEPAQGTNSARVRIVHPTLQAKPRPAPFKHRYADRSGTNNTAAKLDWDKVDEMCRLRRAGFTQKQLGEKYGITQAMVSRIMMGLAWIRANETYPIYPTRK